MRVAIVAESFLPNVNGVSGSVLRVLEHLRSTGHHAMVVAPGLDAPTQHDGTPVLRVPAVDVPRISSLPVGIPSPGMTGAIAEFAPDVVHLASPFVLGAGGMAAARRLGVPAVAVFQTDVAGFADSYGLGRSARAAWRWTRRLHNQADRTLAPSTWAVQALTEHGVQRVHRWGRGVDATRFAPSRRSGALRGEWARGVGELAVRGVGELAAHGVGELAAHGAGELVVGYLGRLAPEKHVERLAALSDLAGVRLVVVGDGPERARLQHLLPGAVFTGQLVGDELAAAMASLDVFVHPGEHETFCQAVQEALASGVPVVAVDQGGPRDLVVTGRTGYLVDVTCFAAGLRAAVTALAQDDLRRHFSLAARRSVLRRTWPAVCDELVGHYVAVQGRTGAGRAA